jgi:hypothetical protein
LGQPAKCGLVYPVAHVFGCSVCSGGGLLFLAGTGARSRSASALSAPVPFKLAFVSSTYLGVRAWCLGVCLTCARALQAGDRAPQWARGASNFLEPTQDVHLPCAMERMLLVPQSTPARDGHGRCCAAVKSASPIMPNLHVADGSSTPTPPHHISFDLHQGFLHMTQGPSTG